MLLDDFRATAKACGYGSLRSQGRRKERVRTRHTRLRDLAARFARGLLEISLTLRIGGRREHRVRAAPAVSCANSAQKKRTRAYRSAEAIRHSLRNGFNAYSVLSPVNGSFATVACESCLPRT